MRSGVSKAKVGVSDANVQQFCVTALSLVRPAGVVEAKWK